jgi:iron complex outermembrane receptor protein
VETTTPAITINPAARTDCVYSCFVQDQFTLSEDLWYLTVGSKLEHNDYTGVEVEPSVRLLWTPDKKRSIWGAISRAVRTPSHGEAGAFDTLAPAAVPPASPLPVYPVVYGNSSLRSEELIAYELGYREQTTEQFSWDLAVFTNSYQRMIGAVAGDPYFVLAMNPYIVQPMTLTNAQAGCVYGAELAATYAIQPTWRLRGAYTYLLMDLHSIDVQTPEVPSNGACPSSQVYLQSGWDLGKKWELDLIGRYVDSLPTYGVPSYIVGDARLAWHCAKNLELSVVGRNLLAGPHAEYGDDQNLGTLHTLVQPEVYGQLVWRY